MSPRSDDGDQCNAVTPQAIADDKSSKLIVDATYVDPDSETVKCIKADSQWERKPLIEKSLSSRRRRE